MSRLYKFVTTASLALAFLSTATTAQASLLVVNGDITSIFNLTSAAPNPADPGNAIFFNNILGTGTSVAIMRTSINPGTEGEVISHYNAQPGVTAAAFNGPITAAALTNVSLLIIPLLDHALVSSEIAALQSYLLNGGNLFVLGETNAVPILANSLNYTNALLSAIGSSISLVGAVLDIGDQTATGSRIANDPLTAGMTSFSYGSTSIVSGGTPLLFTSNNSVMSAYENLNAVPEPATLSLFAAGLAGFAILRRRS